MAAGSSFGARESFAALPPASKDVRRKKIEARLERTKRTLFATRNSASGHSHAVLLHLERHVSKRSMTRNRRDRAAPTRLEIPT